MAVTWKKLAYEDDVVENSLFDADTFLYATNNDTPVATSPANVMAALSGHAAAAFSFNSQDLTGITDLNIDAFAALPSDEHLVGYWAFDDGSGSVAVDGSGNGNDGTLVNMEDADWVDGVVGKCLDFDNTDTEYVNCGNDSVFNDAFSGTNSWTINMWVSPISGGGYYPYFRKGSYTIGLTIHGGRCEGGDGVNKLDHSFTGAPMGSFSMFTLTYDGTNLRAYLDGVYTGIYEWTHGFGDNSGYNVYFGTFWAGTFYGLIDEPRIYSTALTASEVKALYLYPAGNKGSKISLLQVSDVTATTAEINLLDGASYGANDSGGAGFRAVKVPNV